MSNVIGSYQNIAYERQVARLVNQERANAGLFPLMLSPDISHVARVKSRDMLANNELSHQSPTYGSPFDMLRRFGIDFRAAAENIAMGQPTPAAVMDAWMRSPGHRRNILDPRFTDIGVGYVNGGDGNIYWTQMFVTR